MPRDVIFWDLDSTLACGDERQHLIEAEGWDAFHSQCKNDYLLEDMFRLLELITTLARSPLCVGLTGRNEKWRALTMEWLHENNVLLDELLMRPDDDFRSSVDVKIALADSFTDGHITERTMLLIDDRADICDAFNQLGVTTMLVKNRTRSRE